MIKLSPGTKVVVASHNRGKVQEINDLLSGVCLTTIQAADLDLSEPEETGSTFAENATLKARAAAHAAKLPALADDSGLVVDALNGAPGVYSARWAGSERDFALAMRVVEEKLRAVGALLADQRRARFICTLCLATADGESSVWEGRISGSLVWPPRGRKGFGYDPMFLPDGYLLTFGEMEPVVKNRISHRADAFRKFRDAML